LAQINLAHEHQYRDGSKAFKSYQNYWGFMVSD